MSKDVQVSYISNGQGHGGLFDQANAPTALTLIENDFSHHVLKPWVEYNPKTGERRVYMNRVNNEGKLETVRVYNQVATLRREDWLHIDDAIVKTAKPRLKLWGDLMSNGLSYTIPNGMGKTVLETSTQSDISPATISMDGIRQGERDRPEFDTANLPLPIIHKDFDIPARQIAASRNGGSPIDTTTAELATEQVVEKVERLTAGTEPVYKYGGGTIYGYTNFPQRLTKVLTNPTSGGWTPETTRNEVIDMMKLSQDSNHFGSWRLYYSTGFMPYMMQRYNDYEARPLKALIEELDNVDSVSQADYLTGYQMVLVEQKTSVARGVVGMNLTTVQWMSHGGMQFNYKVMAILVPQLRADHEDQTGIVHGSAA